MKAYDAAPREFEHVGLTFELVISATCFAQVKRHRMATITVRTTTRRSASRSRLPSRRSGWKAPLPGDLRPDRGDLGADPPDRARGGRLHPDERTPASGHDSGQRPRALPPRPRPGGRPRPMGYPGNGRADGGAGAGGDADHAHARGGERTASTPSTPRSSLVKADPMMDTPSRKETDRNNYPPVTGIGRDEHVGMVGRSSRRFPGGTTS